MSNPMKYLVILADGLADQPIAELNGKTPVMAANTPHIDQLCAMAGTGLLNTVPASLHPGSEVANMTVMGYDAEKYYNGRGVLEAAAMGVELDNDDLAFRCNLISIKDAKILNHSAGHISNEEAHILIDALNQEFATDRVRFYPGVSYRHLLVIKNAKGLIECTPPHDVPGSPVADVMPHNGKTPNDEILTLVTDLINRSQAFLAQHPVNLKRAEAGKATANSIWPWSPGYRPQMPTIKEQYGIASGSVISAVDLIHGIGHYAGLISIEVEGATGLFDTNYDGKAKAAIEALETSDYVYLHIEAPDEAGHEGNVKLKIKTLEDIDIKVVKPVIEQIVKGKNNVTIAFLPDHPTPCALRTHTRDAIPFFIYRPNQAGDSVTEYNEESVKNGCYGTLNGVEFMQVLVKGLK